MHKVGDKVIVACKCNHCTSQRLTGKKAIITEKGKFGDEYRYSLKINDEKLACFKGEDLISTNFNRNGANICM